MKSIDKDVLASYNAGKEWGRLHKGIGLVEFERTKEVLAEQLPPPPAVIYDIGGGYGEYACHLAARGYEVYLYDLAEKNIEMSYPFAQSQKVCLAGVQVADARSIPRPDESADAILLFGPLYHITETEERALCLKECLRLLKPGGLLFVAAITKYATTLKYLSRYDYDSALDDDEFYHMLETTVKTGIHTKKPMGTAYFHEPTELKEEIKNAGFYEVELRGIMGPTTVVRNLDEIWFDPVKREAILRIVRLLEKEESIMGFSNHFLAMARKRRK
ncbi:MAG: methyltransferase domain-containing protein [Clostridia bacterium]|nr:methyltransferase domain-containing protein [Clostridia bacterium]